MLIKVIRFAAGGGGAAAAAAGGGGGLNKREFQRGETPRGRDREARDIKYYNATDKSGNCSANKHLSEPPRRYELNHGSY